MKNLKNTLFAAACLFAALGCSDTAYAQPTLTVTPSSVTNSNTPLVFNNIPSGSASKNPQTISVAASTNTSIVVQVSPASPWIIVSPAVTNVGPSNAVTLNVSVNTNVNNGQTILGPGTYNGSFSINVSGTSNSQVTVYVTMIVSGSSLFTANPTSLTFSANQGASFATPSGSCPHTQQNGCVVQIASSGAALNYTIQATTTDNHNWLLLNATSGSTGDAGFLVSVNPSALSATMTTPYSGTIIVQSTTTGDSVSIPVSLTVTSSASLTVTPANPPPFLFQTGTNAPPAQQLMVTATGGVSNFTVRVSPTVSWLVVSPLSGQASSTPVPLTLSVSPGGLQPGTYTTNVIVTPAGGADLPAVQVTLVVSNNQLLQLSRTSLSYTSQFSSNPPPDQQVNVTASAGGAVGFTFSSDSSWLTASASGNVTPATLTIHVNPSGLLVQNYTGNITVRPTNGDNYLETIAVSLSIVNGSTVTAGPPDLLFSFQTGQNAPGSQQVNVVSTGAPVPLSITTSTSSCGQNWLGVSASSNSTPSTLTVSVATTGMTAGSCSGTVTVSYNSGNGPTTLAIPVTVAVSATSELVVSMPAGFGNETVPVGSGGFQRGISLASTDLNTPVTFSANATSTGGTWLLVGAQSNVTPQNLVVSFLPSALAPGVYTGQITIGSPSLGATVLTIPVTLTVTSNITVTLSQSSLSFSEAQNGPLPAPASLTLTSSASGATYTATIPSITGGNWLQVSPTSGQANGTVQVNVLANSLSPGDYPAQILFTFQGAATASATVNVTLHVSTPQTVTVSANTLSFAFQITGTPPASQKITVGGTAGVQFSVGTSSSGWLNTDISKGTTPQDITVTVNTAGLAANTFSGSISISAPGALANPIVIPVTLTVTAAPPPQLVTVVSAASGVAGSISVGELITLKGIAIGPPTPVNGTSFTLNASGGVDPKLAGVRVLFDGNPGTPIYVSPTQINVIVPYEVAGRLSTTIVVENQGIQSAGVTVRLADTVPGLFTNTFTGQGQVAATNQNFTYNGATSTGAGFQPATQGSVIALYGTGGGITNPAATTGSVTPVPPTGPLQRIPGTVTATVGGVPATVTFAGNAPSLVTGVVQFNVLIPTGVTGNNVQVQISINGNQSPLGTTIAVQ